MGWNDAVQGEVSVDTKSVSDPVLIRADGQFLYTLASVVDDVEMGITNVIRGADHITNTAVQVQIARALGAGPPDFAHHSLLTGPMGEPLAKRFGDLSIRDLRENGMEPIALLSQLAFLGSSVTVRLCKSIREIVESFDIGSFGTAPTKFNIEELRRLSMRCVASKPHLEVKEYLHSAGVPEQLSEEFWTAIRGNIETMGDVVGWWQIALGAVKPEIDECDRQFVDEAIALLPDLPFDGETWKSWTKNVSNKTGRRGKKLYMPLRKALTGRSSGPEMAALLPLLQNSPKI